MSMPNGKAGNPSLNRSSLQSAKRDAKAAWYAERQDRRYAAIVGAIQNSPRMTTAEDRKIIAINLGQILNHFEKATHRKKEEVLRAANMGESGNSTKQLFADSDAFRPGIPI
jgi:hypothetical protein